MEDIREYLNVNAELRRAIEASNDTLEPHELGMGEHNLNYWFETSNGRKFVLRVNVATQPFHDNQVAYEFAALRALNASGCTPRAIFLDDSPTAPGKGVIVESFCEGRELDFDALQPGDLDAAIRAMADVHAVPVAVDCPLHRPDDPLRELFEECLCRFEIYRKSSFEDVRITRWVERFVARAQQALDTTRPPQERSCIVNTETLPSHFLIDADQAWFIDWERPIVGEVAQDVAYFTSPTTTFWDSDFLFPHDQVEDVVESYWRAVDGRFERGNFDERFQAFRAMTALRSATWCCRALVTYSQDGSHKTGRTIEKLPVYLSDDFMALVAEECFGK